MARGGTACVTSIALACFASCGERAAAPGDDAGVRAIDASIAPTPTVTPTASTSSEPDTTAVPNDAAADVQNTINGCSAPKLSPGHHTRAMTFAGLPRAYDVHVPPGYTGQSAVPVVFEFHPLKVAPAQWELATGWAQVADQNGFIVVWPHGIGESWNVGRCCDPAMTAKIDDVAFVRAILAQLEKDACIDSKRVYASGCSNGGGMSFRLACDAADIVAAVAPVDFDCMTGPTNSPSCASCNPSRPVSITQFRGTADPLVPYNGGPTLVVPGIVFPGAPATFAEWASRNACSGTKSTLANHADCETYAACDGGAETTLCTIPNGLHCTEYLSFGTASIAWESFARHALP